MSQLILQRQRHQARYFTADLGNGVGLDMVLILPGEFLMGSPENELERRDSEGPQHRVTVPMFFMGRYPVTQAQWRAISNPKGSKRKLNPNPSNFKGENRPVEGVSWEDAVEFCDRLSRLTNRIYRLPSEAEWEYACRAGTTTPFHFGEIISTDVANYDGNYVYGRGSKGEYRQETTPVDSFGVANAFGLSDMHGNVWEWCEDSWHTDYKGAPSDGSAWVDQKKGDSRIRRGGSWLGLPRYCRSACRSCSSPDSRDDDVGFRVVCGASRILL